MPFDRDDQDPRQSASGRITQSVRHLAKHGSTARESAKRYNATVLRIRFHMRDSAINRAVVSPRQRQ